ncbi:hypothetical protein HDU84_000420 [Entophlyctis sp. JEL0112]|nr:hypothetical protein HDU84_000420 [Entophlyctis sp. JEL0112]
MDTPDTTVAARAQLQPQDQQDGSYPDAGSAAAANTALAVVSAADGAAAGSTPGLSLSPASVSTVADGLSLALNAAKLVTEFSFATAKFATSAGIHTAKAVVDRVGESTGLDATGITPIISTTLSVADAISLAGIGIGEFFTNLSFSAASTSVNTVGNVFGDSEVNLAIREFAALVKREMERDVEVLVGDSDQAEITRKTLNDIGVFEIAKSLTAWICLQRMVAADYYRVKQASACGESLLPLLARALREPIESNDLDSEQSVDIVIDGEEPQAAVDSEAAGIAIIRGHIGSESASGHSSTADGTSLTTERLFQNIRRYIRFSTGSYGKMAISFLAPSSITFQDQLQEARNRRSSESVGSGHAFFSAYTTRPLPTIYHTTEHNQKATENPLLQAISSSVPRLLPENTTHYKPTFYLILDHPNKAVVLCLRGTLSFHDVMVDLTGDYSTVDIDGKSYFVHSGMQRHAERMTLPADAWLASISSQQAGSLDGTGSVTNPFRTDPTPPYVHEAVAAGLRAHAGYSLVLTGHSLGAALAVLMTLQWGDAATGRVKPSSRFPANTRIHCFAYASPALMASAERSGGIGCGGVATGFEMLVTNVVVGDDVVPSVSLGAIRDLAGVAAYMHTQPNLANGLVSRYIARKTGVTDAADNASELEIHSQLRGACFTNQKLYPVGRAFWIPHADDGSEDVREVLSPAEGMFGDVVFTKDMISDHLPTKYEAVIRGL